METLSNLFAFGVQRVCIAMISLHRGMCIRAHLHLHIFEQALFLLFI